MNKLFKTFSCRSFGVDAFGVNRLVFEVGKGPDHSTDAPPPAKKVEGVKADTPSELYKKENAAGASVIDTAVSKVLNLQAKVPGAKSIPAAKPDESNYASRKEAYEARKAARAAAMAENISKTAPIVAAKAALKAMVPDYKPNDKDV